MKSSKNGLKKRKYNNIGDWGSLSADIYFVSVNYKKVNIKFAIVIIFGRFINIIGIIC